MTLTAEQQKVVAFLKDYRATCKKHEKHITGIIGAREAIETPHPGLFDEKLERHVVRLLEEEYIEGGMYKLPDEVKQEMFLEVYPERRA